MYGTARISSASSRLLEQIVLSSLAEESDGAEAELQFIMLKLLHRLPDNAVDLATAFLPNDLALSEVQDIASLLVNPSS